MHSPVFADIRRGRLGRLLDHEDRVPSLVGNSFPRELELFLVSRKLAKFRGPLIEFHNISSNFPDECLPRNLRSEDRGNSLEVPSISGKCDQQEAR